MVLQQLIGETNMDVGKEQEQALTTAKSDLFHDELRALVKKHKIHGGWFTWVTDSILRDTPEEENLHGTAAVMSFGCRGCRSMALAVGVADLEEDMRDLFAEMLGKMAEGGIERKITVPGPPSATN